MCTKVIHSLSDILRQGKKEILKESRLNSHGDLPYFRCFHHIEIDLVVSARTIAETLSIIDIN